MTWAAVAGVPFYALAVIARHPRRWREVRERFGLIEHRTGEVIWIQAASVGELQVARVLANALQHREPERALRLSVTTPAARRLLRAGVHAADAFTFPVDLPLVMKRAIAAVRPNLFVAIETEIWPNLYDGLRRANVPIVLVNGRISDRSWPRYRRLHRLFRPLLNSIRLVCARTQQDAERFVALGVPAERVHAAGDLKFDRPPPSPIALPARLARWMTDRRVLIAGSTHAGEENIALAAAEAAAHAGKAPVTVILAPRHADRFGEVARLLETSGRPWAARTALPANPAVRPDKPVYVILLDGHGELASLYAHADVAFLGGTLVPVGGHNPLEAAAAGTATVSGPHLANVRHTMNVLARTGGAVIARGERDAVRHLSRLLSDPAESSRRGTAARRTVEAHRGATGRVVSILEPLLRATAT
ncbi:MAG: 3-deoxy-D-manno-octulosonic acid transferase [Acidobacteriota bacterium]